MQFLHDDVILEIWITPEMEADSEAHFVVLERLNLKTEEMVEFIYIYIYILLLLWEKKCCTSYLKISHVTEGVFIRLIDVS